MVRNNEETARGVRAWWRKWREPIYVAIGVLAGPGAMLVMLMLMFAFFMVT